MRWLGLPGGVGVPVEVRFWPSGVAGELWRVEMKADGFEWWACNAPTVSIGIGCNPGIPMPVGTILELYGTAKP
jgi:hypothetical protein